MTLLNVWNQTCKKREEKQRDTMLKKSCLSQTDSRVFRRVLPFLLYVDAKRLEDNQPTILGFHGKDIQKRNTFYLELILTEIYFYSSLSIKKYNWWKCFQSSETDTKMHPVIVILCKTLPKQREYSLMILNFQVLHEETSCGTYPSKISTIFVHTFHGYITFQPQDLVKISPDKENYK